MYELTQMYEQRYESKNTSNSKLKLKNCDGVE